MEMTHEAWRTEWRIDLLTGEMAFRIERNRVSTKDAVDEALHVREICNSRLHSTEGSLVAQVNILSAEPEGVFPRDPSGGLEKLVQILRTARRTATTG